MAPSATSKNRAALLAAISDEAFVAAFWARVARSDSCWLWTGGKSGQYGQLQYQRCRLLAHRFSWQLANATPCPEGLVIRHRCDNPPCVNPDHLEVGSVAQNVRDAYGRGRRTGPKTLRGTMRPNAVLNDESVAQLRRAARSGISIRSLAKEIGASYQVTYRAVRGLGWAHVTEPAVPPKRVYPPHRENFVRSNPEVAASARQLRNQGMALQQIADQLGITKSAAYRCCRTQPKGINS
ncbi:HNH endonuclease [Streptomyces sp. NPDC056323]|uniref:HNH endonuclease n=1 Tax=Streptomyces sp. NPDC056323 TaxID=3345784 RepID=UPI0035D5D368